MNTSPLQSRRAVLYTPTRLTPAASNATSISSRPDGWPNDDASIGVQCPRAKPGLDAAQPAAPKVADRLQTRRRFLSVADPLSGLRELGGGLLAGPGVDRALPPATPLVGPGVAGLPADRLTGQDGATARAGAGRWVRDPAAAAADPLADGALAGSSSGHRPEYGPPVGTPWVRGRGANEPCEPISLMGYGAEGGSRTLTGLPPAVFETAASAIPPPRRVG